MMKDALRGKVQRATRELAEAARDLELLLKAVRGGSRAEKTTVTAVVETALKRVKAARAALAELDPLDTSE